MRTCLKYEIVKDFDVVTDRGAVLTITLSKKDAIGEAENFLYMLSKETGYDFQNGIWEDNFYQVGWIEMDRDDFENVKYDYNNLKKDIKDGVVSLADRATEETQEVTGEVETYEVYLSLARKFVSKKSSERDKEEILNNVSMLSYADYDVFNWFCDRLNGMEYEVTHREYKNRFERCMKYFECNK